MWIQTATGLRVDIENPRPDQISAADICEALPLIPCFVGHQAGGRFPYAYSVAQHSLLVSIVAEKINPNLAFPGLIHDAWKYLFGDITQPHNRMLDDISLGGWTRIRNRYQSIILLKLGCSFPLPDGVELADKIVRATECRDIMFGRPEDWYIDLPDPLESTIDVLPPNIVRHEFQARWVELRPDSFAV